METHEGDYAKNAQAALAALIDTVDNSSDGEEKVRDLFEAIGVTRSMFDIREDNLVSDYGFSRLSAQAIELLAKLTRYVGAEQALEKRKIKTYESASKYLMAMMYGRRIEYCYLLCLNRAGNYLSCPLLQRGTVDQSAVYMRELALTAIENKAVYCVLSHNHPSGGLQPSAADIDVTINAIEALRAVNVALIDHVIVTDQDAVSIRSLGKPAERMWLRDFETDKVLLGWFKKSK